VQQTNGTPWIGIMVLDKRGTTAGVVTGTLASGDEDDIFFAVTMSDMVNGPSTVSAEYVYKWHLAYQAHESTQDFSASPGSALANAPTVTHGDTATAALPGIDLNTAHIDGDPVIDWAGLQPLVDKHCTRWRLKATLLTKEMEAASRWDCSVPCHLFQSALRFATATLCMAATMYGHVLLLPKLQWLFNGRQFFAPTPLRTARHKAMTWTVRMSRGLQAKL
jgi:hypothetical protein